MVVEVEAVSLLCVPQPSQIRMAFSSPVDSSRRFPQSVQKTRDPIAAIFRSKGCRLVKEIGCYG